MNVVAETHASSQGRRPVAAPHATHKFKLLLKREFWEHKGGFFWAPLITGAISLVMTIMAIVVLEVLAGKAIKAGKLQSDGEVMVNGLDLSQLMRTIEPSDLDQVGGLIDLSFIAASIWPLVVLAFVVFFYCLGALYDERKDRSVLFWKSLPVSDRDTVLSKAASALLVAPLIAIGVALVCIAGWLAILSVLVVAHNGPLAQLWGLGNPLRVISLFIAAIPIYALWALPTVGWLLLCSSWARSKPFLWAIMIPVFAGIFVSWFDLMQVFNVETGWFWKNVVGRMLLSVVPGTWIDAANIGDLNIDGPQALARMWNLNTLYSPLLTPQLWIGALAGAAMIFGAIQLRRRRELAD